MALNEHMLKIVQIHEERNRKIREARKNIGNVIPMDRWRKIQEALKHRKDEEKEVWKLYFESQIGAQ